MNQTNKERLFFVFFVMSPMFPGNNFIEWASIGFIAGVIADLFGTDAAILRTVFYGIYNLVGIVGFFVLRNQVDHPGSKEAFNAAFFLELAGAITMFVLVSRYVPSPWDSVLLGVLSLIFLRNRIYAFYKRIKERSMN